VPGREHRGTNSRKLPRWGNEGNGPPTEFTSKKTKKSGGGGKTAKREKGEKGSLPAEGNTKSISTPTGPKERIIRKGGLGGPRGRKKGKKLERDSLTTAESIMSFPGG